MKLTVLVPVVLPTRVTVSATLPDDAAADADGAMERVAEVGAEDVTTAVDVILSNVVAPVEFVMLPLSVMDVPEVANALAPL